MYSAKEAIKLKVKNVPHNIKDAFLERSARAFIEIGGNNCNKIKNTETWNYLVYQVKRELQGHFNAEVIYSAEYSIGE